jgi:hypothetical protein
MANGFATALSPLGGLAAAHLAPSGFNHFRKERVVSFVEERAVKATRKRHVCTSCDKWIEPGEPAVNWAGVVDGEFSSAHFHPECRKAEVELNELHDWRFGDDWLRLCDDAEPEDYPWLKAEHPLPYRRMLMTREQWAAQGMQLREDTGTVAEAEGLQPGSEGVRP